MKNKDFFYQQYNKINWKNQEKTGINSYINNYIIDNVILKHQGEDVSVFDMGFGIGYFIKMLLSKASSKYRNIIVEGCEPSLVNFAYLNKQKFDTDIKLFPTGFLETETATKFNFVTSIYVFPHFLFEDLEAVVRKINLMLKENGKFVLVLANEKYLQEKLKAEKDFFIESGEVTYNGKNYNEVLHYTDIPDIGKVIDYNRDEQLYISLFEDNGLLLQKREVLDDNGFVCSLFVFEKRAMEKDAQKTEWEGLISHNKHQIKFGEAIIEVNDGVFMPDPNLTYSSKLIIENLPPLNHLSVADVGTGTGVIAIISALRGAVKVVATDVSELAIRNAEENVLLNNVQDKVKVIRTSLLNGIDGKFDIICANLPILDTVWESQGIDPDGTVKSFIESAKNNLNSNGKIYIPWASFAEANRNFLEDLFRNSGYTFQLIKKDVFGYTWYLYVLE